jgi:ABC-type antimicrobial peptide transport system permease subunit
MNTNSNISFEFLTSSENFVETNGISLVRGRDIDVTRFPADTASCLINETAQKVMGLEDPLGQLISEDSTNWKIVGVIKDFIISSPSQVVSPALIVGSKGAGFISIRLRKSGHSSQQLQKVKSILMKYNPNFLSEYQFADDDYSAKFRQPENAAILINSFTLVAVFISCMGLFGLAAYTAENKTKEIGIRKILGASVTRITVLLVKEFVKPVMIAIVIASPLAWIFMNFFLSQFSYRTGISWWILVIAGSGALFIALFTVSFQSVRAAIANPVKNLRTE